MISDESAQEQLDSFLRHYDIDLASMPKAQADGVNVAITRILRAIKKGQLEIEGPVIKQTLSNPSGEVTTITYGELTGQNKVAMSNKEPHDHYGRTYALIGSLTKLGEGAILKLKGADLSIAECVGLLFLQV